VLKGFNSNYLFHIVPFKKILSDFEGFSPNFLYHTIFITDYADNSNFVLKASAILSSVIAVGLDFLKYSSF